MVVEDIKINQKMKKEKLVDYIILQNEEKRLFSFEKFALFLGLSYVIGLGKICWKISKKSV